MDRKLIAWGLRPTRAVARSRRPAGLPRLWLFTDTQRLPDPRPAATHLPVGRAGIIFRHDDAADRIALGQELARICRRRRLTLVVAGDGRLAASLRAGTHLRNGYWPDLIRPRGAITSSAHSAADLLRAARAGAEVIFLSPTFPTHSHPGAPGLGASRWAAIARRIAATGARVAALGGISGSTIQRLPPTCYAAGAITAFSD